MRLATMLVMLAGTYCAYGAPQPTTHTTPHTTTHTTPHPTEADRIKKLEAISQELGRQLMMQQLYVEEMTRTGADSGIKQLRMRIDSFKSYSTSSFSAGGAAAIHDHSQLERTPGMGELVAVLNGVEFRTRHNDYRIVKPTQSRTFDAVEDIAFPPVPPSVLNQSTVFEQSAELREYFKAWRDQNVTHRDYRPYFKPVLCYLEGAWTMDKNFNEPFSSERHHIEANSWFDLQEKIRYTSLTGDRLGSQNLAFLPTSIVNITDGIPVMAQWNYRIVCHPLHKEVDTRHLRPIDDFAERFGEHKDVNQFFTSRSQRFLVDEKGGLSSRYYHVNELDEMMYEIPGKDNYGVNITDKSLGSLKMKMDQSGPINVGMYHRRWKVGDRDAMGDTVGYRGFADRNLFVAENTQDRIAPVRVHHCYSETTNGHSHNVCQDLEKRVSYAIPLEIIFLTPLQTWNPYHIEYHGYHTNPAAKGVEANNRNGSTTVDKAYNGTHSNAYYFTPVEFFTGAEVAVDPADTNRAATGVLDRQGNLRLLKESGIRIQLPNIAGVGVLRTRYPIFPVHAEGDVIWKQVEALKDMMMRMDTFSKYFEALPNGLVTYSASPSHHG